MLRLEQLLLAWALPHRLHLRPSRACPSRRDHRPADRPRLQLRVKTELLLLLLLLSERRLREQQAQESQQQ